MAPEAPTSGDHEGPVSSEKASVATTPEPR